MAYALKYSATLVWVGPGAGPMSALTAPSLPGNGGGVGQAIQFDVTPALVPVVNGATTYTPPGGTAMNGALSAADVTTLTNAMASDIAAQMNAVIGRLQSWVAGLN